MIYFIFILFMLLFANFRFQPKGMEETYINIEQPFGYALCINAKISGTVYCGDVSFLFRLWNHGFSSEKRGGLFKQHSVSSHAEDFTPF